MGRIYFYWGSWSLRSGLETDVLDWGFEIGVLGVLKVLLDWRKLRQFRDRLRVYPWGNARPLVIFFKLIIGILWNKWVPLDHNIRPLYLTVPILRSKPQPGSFRCFAPPLSCLQFCVESSMRNLRTILTVHHSIVSLHTLHIYLLVHNQIVAGQSGLPSNFILHILNSIVLILDRLVGRDEWNVHYFWRHDPLSVVILPDHIC